MFACHLSAADSAAWCQGYDGMQRDVEKCMRNAHVLKDMLEMVGIKTMLNELSNTVVFERCVDGRVTEGWGCVFIRIHPKLLAAA